MKPLFAVLLASIICFTGEAASVSDSIKTIRAVGPEGQGNTAAAKAWKSLAQADAAALPEILRAMKDSSPLSANWLRAAVDTIADRGGKLPQQALLDFIADQKQEPRARRLAFELIQKSNPKLADKLIPGLINDPSVELRRDAVAHVLEAGTAKQTAKQTQAAVKDFRKALDAARDIDQIQAATTALRQLNETVDLPRHFGFLMHWNVIGPFDNTERKGFATVFPPEKKIDLSATYEGKAGKVEWSEFITADEYGMVDINKAYPGPGDGLKEVTAFAYTEYTAASAGPARRPSAGGGVFGVGKGGDFLEAIAGAGVGFVDVHHAVLVGRDEFAPFHLAGFAFIRGREIDFFLGGKHSGKAFSLGVVKRPDNIPVHEKPKMPWEIDRFIELA